jgi:hypothetical protein
MPRRGFVSAQPARRLQVLGRGGAADRDAEADRGHPDRELEGKGEGEVEVGGEEEGARDDALKPSSSSATRIAGVVKSSNWPRRAAHT